MNKVILMGRLVADPTIRYTQGGTAVANYTLAVDRRSKDDTADFIRCVAWDKRAQFAETYLHKGTKLLVTGHIMTGSYKKDGKTVYTTDVIADEQEFCESRNAQSAPPAADPAPAAEPDQNGFVEIPEGIDQELPFN